MAELSLRAYARHRGVTLGAVQKAIATGRIKRLENGKVESETADDEWARNTNPARAPRLEPQPHPEPAVPPLLGGALLAAPETLREHTEWPDWVEELARREPPLRVPKVLPSPGVSAEATAFVDVRTNREYWDAVTARLKALRLAQQLVDKASIERDIFTRAAAERDSLLGWPPRVSAILAAELGVDEARLRPLLERELRAYLAERSRIGNDQPAGSGEGGDGKQ